MQLSVRDMVNASEVLAHLGKQKIKNPKFLYWITLTRRKFEAGLEAFETARNNLVTTYSVPDPKKPGTYKFAKMEQRLEFQKELDGILDQTEEFDIKPIRLSLIMSSLEADPNLDLVPDQIYHLWPILVDDMEATADDQPS